MLLVVGDKVLDSSGDTLRLKTVDVAGGDVARESGVLAETLKRAGCFRLGIRSEDSPSTSYTVLPCWRTSVEAA